MSAATLFRPGQLSTRRHARLASSAYNHQAVFLTICTFQRKHLFGVVRMDGGAPRVELAVVGEICREEWTRHVGQLGASADAFIVMPNHIHAVVRLDDVLLAEFVGRVKSAVTSRARRETDDSLVRVWQRGYHDRIIRDDFDLRSTRTYITDNPSRWVATP
jgi:putative transposase